METQYPATTLRHLLCQEKPKIRRNTKLAANTTGQKWPELQDITVWHDFSLENLNESYGHILDMDISNLGLVTPQPTALQGVVASEDNDIKHLIGWHDEMMQQTVRFAKRQLRLCQSINLTFTYSTPDNSFFARLPTLATKFQVDHIIGIDDPFQPVLVVGLGRLSTKWSCTRLISQLGDPSKQISWPLRQLANLCKFARTRYGYIQTEDELVACCFSRTAGNFFKVAIMPIPWTKYGVDTLTTELALWWLCMLALSPNQDRSIVVEEKMFRINEWNGVQGSGLQHRYSNFVKPKHTDAAPTWSNNVFSPDSLDAWMESQNNWIRQDLDTINPNCLNDPILGNGSNPNYSSNLDSNNELGHVDPLDDGLSK